MEIEFGKTSEDGYTLVVTIQDRLAPKDVYISFVDLIDIIDIHNGLCLDNETDKRKLLTELVKKAKHVNDVLGR